MFGRRVFLQGGYFDGRAGLLLEDWPGINLGVTPDNWDKEVVAAQRLDSANSLPSVPWVDQAAPWRGPLVDSMTTWAWSECSAYTKSLLHQNAGTGALRYSMISYGSPKFVYNGKEVIREANRRSAVFSP
jgi:hypothetical protein